jgi:hypothetical protein
MLMSSGGHRFEWQTARYRFSPRCKDLIPPIQTEATLADLDGVLNCTLFALHIEVNSADEKKGLRGQKTEGSA